MRTEEREAKDQKSETNRLIQTIHASVESSSHSIAIGQLTVNLTVSMRPRCRQRLPVRLHNAQKRAA